MVQNKKIKVLLLEGVHESAVTKFKNFGCEVEQSGKLSEDELLEKIKEINIIGVRSKTVLSKKVLDSASNLYCIGSYTLNAKQTDLEHAMKLGIPVFNSPFAHARSVAELILAEMIILSRKVIDHYQILNEGGWMKTSKGCYEVRGKTLGIIGYGHVGTQLSVLAESMGMIVQFYDIRTVLAHGNAIAVTLDQLLSSSNFISVHASDIQENKLLIGKEEFSKMKKGTFFLNASAGRLVDYEALAECIKSEHIAGCAIDAHMDEPLQFVDKFTTVLQHLPNTILTPHVYLLNH
jgi:D-3-phosphoglycerate dehydrogenase / 2-oxoglutarate reductase